MTSGNRRPGSWKTLSRKGVTQVSADNYYVIRKHPDGGYAAVMGFESDPQMPRARKGDKAYPTVDEALTYACSQYSEYGVEVHPECEHVPPVAQMGAHLPGQPVLVEGETVSFEPGEPYGEVTVKFPTATDPSHLLDGVVALVPEPLVHSVDVDIPEDWVSEEGYYDEMEEDMGDVFDPVGKAITALKQRRRVAFINAADCADATAKMIADEAAYLQEYDELTAAIEILETSQRKSNLGPVGAEVVK